MMRESSLLARTAAVLLGLLVLVAVFADLLCSHAPLLARTGGHWHVLPAVTEPARAAALTRELREQDGFAVWAPVRASPTAKATDDAERHWLGTDDSGRDVLAQIIFGARTLVTTTLGALLVALVVGVPLGAAAGRGNVADALLSRTVEWTGAVPTVVAIAVLHASELVTSTWVVAIALGALRAAEVARLVRGEVLRVSGTDFVLAARALGASPIAVVRRHLAPHLFGPVLVSASLGAAAVVLVEAALSYLGLGVPGEVPSWGALLGRAGVAPTGRLLPGLAIVITTACLAILAETLEDRLAARRGGAGRV